MSAGSPGAWRDLARRAEDLGYATFSVPDHYLGPGPALTAAAHPPQEVATIPALAVAAEATSTIHVGCRVACVGYHQPAVLAKELATIDFFSGGRLEIGLGAGWMRTEYDALGIPFPPASERIARLAATVRLLRAWAGPGAVDVADGDVHVHGFDPLPAPSSPTGPPIMIGGGSPAVLSLAAREADIVSLNFDNRTGRLGPDAVSSGSGEATAAKLDWVRSAAGARLDQLELEIGAYFTVVTGDRERVAAGLAARLDLAAGDLAHHPHALIGSVEEIVDTLEERRASLGVSYVTVDCAAMDVFAPVVARLSGT